MNTDSLNQNLIERVNIGDMLRRRSRDSANTEALVVYENGERKSRTYAELNQRVNQLARGLREKGLEQHGKLALISANNLDFLTVMFACYKLGAVAVPINFLQSPDDIRYNIEHSESSIIVYDPLLEEIALPCIDGNSAILCSVSMALEKSKADNSIEDLIKGQDSSNLEDCVILDRDTAHMIYTSGTTSRPKGVETSHLSLYFSAMGNAINLDAPRGSNHLVVLPMFHCAAVSLLLTSLNLGSTIVIQPSFDAETVVQILKDERIHSTALLPMMWKALLTVDGIETMSFPDFEYGIYAMAPMDRESLQKIRDAFGCEMHLGSGQTEFAPSACLFYDGSEQEDAEGNYWGVPAVGVDQAIIDDQGNEVAQGELGEICWRGPQAMSGYFKNPEASAEASQFGWHHSGDLGLIDKYGQLMFVDRKKDTIKSGGENVSSVKVEQVLLGLEGIALAAAFGVPHDRWFEAVCVAVLLAPGAELTEDAVIDHCKQHLGGFETPKKVFFVDNFEYTGTGKIRKVALRKTYADAFAEES